MSFEKNKLLSILLIIITSSCTVKLTHNQLLEKTKAYRTISDKKWREDYNYLYDNLKNIHPDPYQNTSKSILDSLFKRYSSNKKYSSNERLVNMMHILAMVGDAHTQIHLKSLPLHALPIKIRKLDKGYYITAADKEHEKLIGKRVTELNDIGIESVIERLKMIISDETDTWTEFCTERYLRIYEILNGIGILGAEKESPAYVTTVSKSDTIELQLNFNNRVKHGKNRLLHISDKYDTKQHHLKRQGSQSFRWYWYKRVDSLDLLYFQYNTCRSHPKKPLDEFFKDMRGTINSEGIMHFIIDLRNNRGGSTTYFSENITRWIQEDKKDSLNVFVLIGKRTFSSAIFAAAEMHKLDAILYGRETGQKCNHFGEYKQEMLPNTSIIVNISTKKFELIPEYQGGLRPDSIVKTRIDDIKKGHDPVLEKVLEDIRN